MVLFYVVCSYCMPFVYHMYYNRDMYYNHDDLAFL